MDNEILGIVVCVPLLALFSLLLFILIKNNNSQKNSENSDQGILFSEANSKNYSEARNGDLPNDNWYVHGFAPHEVNTRN